MMWLPRENVRGVQHQWYYIPSLENNCVARKEEKEGVQRALDGEEI